MIQYISLLRGINVSGQKKITMDSLMSIYKQLHLNDVTKLHVTFLYEKPDQAKLNLLYQFNSGKDTFQLIDNVIYLFCADGYGRTKLNNTFFEKKNRNNRYHAKLENS